MKTFFSINNMHEANETGDVWPPTIHAGLPPSLLKRKQPSGWASAWVGGAGLSLWLCAVAVAGLLPDPVLNKVWIGTLMNAALVMGPVLALAGAALGSLGRGTRRGLFGLALSLLVLINMGSLIVGIRYASGHWPWFRQVKVNDSCGCG